MSRTPASHSFQVVRGATWEDALDYEDENGAPVDLTGYEARMQVRTLEGQYGVSTAETLLMELLSNGDAPRLFIETPEGGTVPSRIRIAVAAADVALLNPDNARKTKAAYSIELFTPAGANPEYVIPLVQGKVSCKGEVTR